MDKRTETILRTIPGVGPSMARDLWLLGIRSLEELAEKDPQRLYDDLCALTNSRQDRCVLYVFRAAVYFAATRPEEREPDKLLWWNWKDPAAKKR